MQQRFITVLHDLLFFTESSLFHFQQRICLWIRSVRLELYKKLSQNESCWPAPRSWVHLRALISCNIRLSLITKFSSCMPCRYVTQTILHHIYLRYPFQKTQPCVCCEFPFTSGYFDYNSSRVGLNYPLRCLVFLVPRNFKRVFSPVLEVFW